MNKTKLSDIITYVFCAVLFTWIIGSFLEINSKNTTENPQYSSINFFNFFVDDEEEEMITNFSYNCKNGNLYANDKNIVYTEKIKDTYFFYIKSGRSRRYLENSELKQLANTAKWFMENQGCDFGEPIENLLSREYLYS